MRYIVAIMLMVSVVLTVTVSSQESRPDFSGNWMINRELSEFGEGRDGKPRSPRVPAMQIEQDEKTLKITMISTDRDGKERETEMKYSLEGKKSKNKTNWGKQESTVRWIEDGQVLEISSATHIKRGDREFDMESKQLLSMSEGRLVIETVRYSPRGDFETKAVYERILEE